MNKTFCLDPIYYDSTPWEFILIEVDIAMVREYFDDPKLSQLYAKDVHKTPCPSLNRSPYEFSRFVQLKHSPWMRFDLTAHCQYSESELESKSRPDLSGLQEHASKETAMRIVEDIRRSCEINWNRRKNKAVFLSSLFETRAMLFGYENTGDTLYYELFEKGNWQESFTGGLYETGKNDTYCQLKSVIRPECRPGNDEMRFVEETFVLWSISVPFISLLPCEKNPSLLKGALAECSVFSEDDIKGFDCGLIDQV